MNLMTLIWRCAAVVLLAFGSWPPAAQAQSTNNYYPELGYREQGGWVPVGSSPAAVCASYASMWGWNVNGFSTATEQRLPGLWACQRYYNGVMEPSQYTYVRGVCQRNPAPIKTGSYWGSPYWDEAVGDCYCSAPKVFDGTVEWCDYVAATPPPVRDESCTAGNPVQPGTGTKRHSETDYAGAGAHALSLVRNYRSDSVPVNSLIDVEVRWMHSYQARLVFNPYGNGNPTVAIRPDATLRRFTSSSTTTPRAWQGDSGTRDKLVELRDAAGALTGWQYTVADNDAVETYSAAGRLLSIKERNGWTATLAYGTAGELLSVTNQFGRQLRFTYDAQGRLAELLPPAAVSGTGAGSATSPIRYTYGEAASLGAGVPVSGQLASVTWQDGAVRRYHYEDARFAHALTGITDEAGVRWATYSYDGQRRVASEQHAGGVDRLDFAYSGNQTTITDYSGAGGGATQSTYTFDNQAGVLRPAAVSAPCPLCGNTQQASTYDANGRLAKAIAHDGTVTFYAYDSKGRETERASFPASYGSATTRPALIAATQVTSTKWHATWMLATQVAEPNKVTANTYNGKGMLTGQSWTATTDATGAAKFAAVKTGSTYATGWGYNSNSLATSIVQKVDAVEARRWAFVFNALGDNTKVTATEAGVSTVATLASSATHGRLASLSADNGASAQFGYDMRNRLLSAQMPDYGVTLSYDARSLLTDVRFSDGS